MKKTLRRNIGILMIFMLSFSFFPNSIRKSFADTRYDDFVSNYKHKQESIIDDNLLIVTYILSDGSIQFVDYIDGKSTTHVYSIGNKLYQVDLSTNETVNYQLDNILNVNNFTPSSTIIQPRSSSSWGTVTYSSSNYGTQKLSIFATSKSYPNSNFSRIVTGGTAVSVITGLLSIAFGILFPPATTLKMLIVLGISVASGKILTSGNFTGVGDVTTYTTQIKDANSTRIKTFTDGIVFSGTVNGKSITIYDGVYPQFRYMQDRAVADYVFHQFWDGSAHVSSWN